MDICRADDVSVAQYQQQRNRLITIANRACAMARFPGMLYLMERLRIAAQEGHFRRHLRMRRRGRQRGRRCDQPRGVARIVALVNPQGHRAACAWIEQMMLALAIAIPPAPSRPRRRYAPMAHG